MGIFWYLAILALVTLTSWIVAARIEAPDRVVRALVGLVLFHFFTVMSVQLSAAAEMTGLIGSADLISVTGAAAVLLILAAAVCFGMRDASRPRDFEGVQPGARAAGEPLPKYLISIGAIVLASWLLFAIDASTSFDFGWDALHYHIPVAVRWLQSSSFAIPELTGWRNGLPSNGELGIFLLLGAGLERIVFLYNWLAVAVGMISVFLLARRISASTEAAILSAALLAVVPIVQYQASSGYIDLYGACFVLAGVALFCERAHPDAPDTPDGKRWYVTAIVLAGIACGIGVGAKPVYYTYGALCGLGATVLIWRDRDMKLGPTLSVSSLLALCMLVPCIFWIWRAAAATGNPIYPIAVAVFGIPIFDGFHLDQITHRPNLEILFIDSTWKWVIYPWVESKTAGPPYGTGSGMGAVWAAFVPVGVAFAAVTAFRAPEGDRKRTLIALLILFAAMVALWWFGLRRLPRFGMAFIVFSCVFAAPIFATLLAARPRPMQLLLVVVFAASAVLSTFSPLHGFLGRVRANEWSRAATFEMPAVIDALPEGAVIWNAGADEAMTFALFGAQLTNRVLTNEWDDVPDAQDYIKLNRVEYVVERAPFCCDEVASFGGEILFEGRVGPTHDWRVWKLP